jgi:Cu+-exporting ATPase
MPCHVGDTFDIVSRRCPEKIMAAVESLSPKVEIVKPIIMWTDRILELAYQPSAPEFTLRTIISNIASSKSPPFRVSIHRPPSLESRARSMQVSECSALLRRLILAIVIGIPTFLIGVAFMSLVKDDEPVKVFFMKPMWVGNASRSQWALFFLSSPVQFYSADMFHRRSIKEISALWRKDSTNPIYKRFIRFGSMNLLVRVSESKTKDYVHCCPLGFCWRICGLFFVHRPPGPRGGTAGVSIWNGRHYYIF